VKACWFESGCRRLGPAQTTSSADLCEKRHSSYQNLPCHSLALSVRTSLSWPPSTPLCTQPWNLSIGQHQKRRPVLPGRSPSHAADRLYQPDDIDLGAHEGVTKAATIAASSRGRLLELLAQPAQEVRALSRPIAPPRSSCRTSRGRSGGYFVFGDSDGSRLPLTLPERARCSPLKGGGIMPVGNADFA
jgi:hypothetical protein